MPDTQDVEVMHGARRLFPDGTTKAQLVRYYRKVAPTMLPHLAHRPLMMQRFPRGVEHGGFYQKDVAGQVPDWVHTIEVKKEGGTVCHVVCDDPATLTYLANQDCITLHGRCARRPGNWNGYGDSGRAGCGNVPARAAKPVRAARRNSTLPGL